MLRLLFFGIALLGASAHARTDEVERGRRLLSQYRCGACHTIPGVASARGTVAQDLSGWKHRSYIAGRVANRPATLAQWIVSPQSVIAGATMPSMGVPSAEARAMAAYLAQLE
ncbi:c-type cytochrome [Ramlibacter sp.]|uniref:c-type cytochrome n=1 Tax=Ramlibacter sp. TaxID=1917967 RepID=UPI003D0E1A47